MVNVVSTKAILFFQIATVIAFAGCQKELDGQNKIVLRVTIPDHANQGMNLITLNDQEIAFADFVPRFRSLVESRRFNLIQVYWGKSGSDELEKIVSDIADRSNVRIEKWVFSSSGVELWPREGWSPTIAP